MLVVEVPRVCHHYFEVAVVFNAGPDFAVVVHELLRADLSVPTFFVLKALMDLEGVQKFSEHFLLRLFT